VTSDDQGGSDRPSTGGGEPNAAPTPRRFAFALATAVPFIAYMVTGSGLPYWLDAAELVAAAVDLDISHPPGQPLFALVARCFALLPLGALDQRVMLASASCTALAAGLLYRAIDQSLARVTALDPYASAALSLAASWVACLSTPIWFQAVRAEVYALQLLGTCFVLERVGAYLDGRNGKHAAPLHHAALALGLILGNHHLVALLLMPAFFWACLSVMGTRRRRALLQLMAFGSLGLFTYAYLPLRALARPPMNLGSPTDPHAFFWVVSGRVYGSTVATVDARPLDELYAEVLILLVQSLQVPAVLAAVAGFYLLLRNPAGRATGTLWLLTWLCNFAVAGAMGLTLTNPDRWGYLAPGIASFAASSTLLVGLLLEALPAASRALLQKVIGTLVALGVLLAALPAARRCDLSGFTAADDFDDRRRRALPARSVVVATTPQCVFSHWGGRATEALRPDLVLMPLPFVAYPGKATQLVDRHPVLRELTAGYLRDPASFVAALRTLAARRPVLVELDTRLPLSLYPHLTPEGLLYRVHPEPVTAAQLRRAMAAESEALAFRRRSLGASDRESARQALWLHYVAALHREAHGQRAAALRELQAALSAFPEDRWLRRLAAELTASPSPIDLRPLLTAD